MVVKNFQSWRCPYNPTSEETFQYKVMDTSFSDMIQHLLDDCDNISVDEYQNFFGDTSFHDLNTGTLQQLFDHDSGKNQDDRDPLCDFL